MKKTLLLLIFFVAGCANQEFPFCCDQTGVSNVPYMPTYHFELGTGFTDIGGSTSFLTIISQADVANLFNAANVSQVPGTGVIGGAVVDFSGVPASDVVLVATDANGNRVGDLFYNSLGGIPDFSVTSGTSPSGGFTLLNAPPGEIYFKAVQGARGNGSLLAFADSASLIQLSVFHVVPPLVGVTGSTLTYDLESKIPGAYVTPVGLPGLSVFSSSGAGYRLPALGSDSLFLIKGTAARYFPTYQEALTDLSSRPSGAIDVTQKIYFLSQSYFSDILKKTGYSGLNSANGILIGSARDSDGTPRAFPLITLTDDRGVNLNINPGNMKSRIYYQGSYPVPGSSANIPTLFFYDSTGTVVSWFDQNGGIMTHDCKKDYAQGQPTTTCPPIQFGNLDGRYIALDLPAGTIHLSLSALESTAIGLSYYTGEEQADIFSGSATLKDLPAAPVTLGTVVFSQGLTGKVTGADGVTPVPFASLFALGNSPSLTTADIYGFFNIPASANLFLDQGNYIMKVSAPPLYLDTYQAVQASPGLKSLVLYSSSQVNQYLSASGLLASYDSTLGIVTGMVIDRGTGRGTDGITLEARDLSGNRVGDVRYFDSSGLPTLTRATSKNGGYIIYNLPPGWIQIQVISQDDSGNLLTHSYAGGIHIADLKVNNSPPPAIQVSGTTRDLDGTSVPGANLSLIGEKINWTSDGGGNFSAPLSPYSQFKIKARAAQSGIDTYNYFSTLNSDINGVSIVSLTNAALQTTAQKAGLLIDPSGGLLGGKIAAFGLSSPLPIPTFQASAIPLTEISPQNMTGGLFDSDNEIDLAVVNSTDNTLTILLGGGDGTFRPASGSPLCMPRGTVMLPGQTCLTGANPVAVRAADLNGDGILDLVVANKAGNSLTVLLGSKKGNFVPVGSPIPLLPGSLPVGLVIGDFNNDQKMDMVVINSGNNSVSYLQGNGNGTFNPSIFTFNSGGLSPIAILSQDFNGDGNLDLAIANSGSNSISIFLGFGNGVFTPAPNSPVFVGISPVGISSGDINGDGVVDLVVPNGGSSTIAGSSSLTLLLGKGGGLFKPADHSPIPLSASPRQVALNDINLDGRLDILAALSSGSIAVLNGLGNGSFTPESPSSSYFVGGNPSHMNIADFNDDTVSDLIVYQQGPPGGTAALAFLPGVEVGLPNISVSAADLDGNSVGQVRYFLNGNVVPATTSTMTDTSGKFLIFNAPPGIKNIHATQGGSGNRLMTSYAGGAAFGTISVIPPNLNQIVYSGKTTDVVGSQSVRFVPGVGVSFLGTGKSSISDPVTSNFNLNVDANSAMFIKLQK